MVDFIYKAKVIKVYDGDTITCNIDCGFGIILKKQKIRLHGINAPEMKGDSRDEGIQSRDELREKILDNNIILKTFKDKKGKYGRYLGLIYYDDININEWMIDNNYAVKYSK